MKCWTRVLWSLTEANGEQNGIGPVYWGGFMRQESTYILGALLNSKHHMRYCWGAINKSLPQNSIKI